MRIIYSPSYRWWRVKLSEYHYLGVRVIKFVPFIMIKGTRDINKIVDEFFDYLLYDACWIWFEYERNINKEKNKRETESETEEK